MGRIFKPRPLPRVLPPWNESIPPCKNVLVFCTAWSDSQERWNNLYGRWIKAVSSGKLVHHQIFMPDDGSPILPEFPDMEIIYGELPVDQPKSKIVMYHWLDNLGVVTPINNYPGWYRSYMMAATYAEKYGFDKVVHLEADAFLISDRAYNYVNRINSGWVTFWCPKYRFAENAIQIIAGRSLQSYIELSKSPYIKFAGQMAENYTPFTHIEKGFIGDRFGEYLPEVPPNADFACQVTAGMDIWW